MNNSLKITVEAMQAKEYWYFVIVVVALVVAVLLSQFIMNYYQIRIRIQIPCTGSRLQLAAFLTLSRPVWRKAPTLTSNVYNFFNTQLDILT